VLHAVNPLVAPPPCSRAARVSAGRTAELDEMGSFVGATATARWLGHALDPHSGRVLADVVGPRKEALFRKLNSLLAPFGITRYYTDKAGVYRGHLPPAQHPVGKLTMQKIERKPLTLRTRLKRLACQTLGFSRSWVMHDLIMGVYMNRVEFGCAV
jgi:insertion element IS1 protein InsB